MTAQAHDSIAPVIAGKAGRRTAGRTGQRAAADVIHLTQRDIDGLLLCGEHYAAPYDLLAVALRVAPGRLPAILRRWRQTGYVATGRLGPGPGWCWLTRDGMNATGLGFTAMQPALGRLAHIRAVLAARLWLETSSGWSSGHAWWRSERRLLGGQSAGRGGHVADAEIHWPSVPGSRHGGQIWAVEVELSPKPVARTTRIMGELLTATQYSLVVYLTAPAAGPVVKRAAASLPPDDQSRVAVQELPAIAFLPEPTP
jgi:hypothetical protein